MVEKIEWTDNLQEAIRQATLQGKSIVLDFFNPQ